MVRLLSVGPLPVRVRTPGRGNSLQKFLERKEAPFELK